jgi:hypothetical protein
VEAGLASAHTKHVPPFALAKQRGRHHLVVKKEIEAAGIKPPLDPRKLGATFYRRVEL